MMNNGVPAKLSKVFSEALKGLVPPDDLTVTEWAEAKRRICFILSMDGEKAKREENYGKLKRV